MSTTPLRRRVRQLSKGDQRETDLIASAERHLERGTFTTASVAELAADAGVSRSSFYFYFASKDALLASVIDATHVEIAERLSAALSTAETPAHRIIGAVRAGADAWWEHRAVMAAAMALAHQVPELGERMIASMQAVNEQCTELLLAHGTVPERRDRAAAQRLIETLALMNERVISHAVSRAQSRAELAPTEARLSAVWLRSLGIAPD